MILVNLGHRTFFRLLEIVKLWGDRGYEPIVEKQMVEDEGVVVAIILAVSEDLVDCDLVGRENRIRRAVADQVELEWRNRIVVAGVEVLEFGKALQRAGRQFGHHAAGEPVSGGQSRNNVATVGSKIELRDGLGVVPAVHILKGELIGRVGRMIDACARLAAALGPELGVETQGAGIEHPFGAQIAELGLARARRGRFETENGTGEGLVADALDVLQPGGKRVGDDRVEGIDHVGTAELGLVEDHPMAMIVGFATRAVGPKFHIHAQTGDVLFAIRVVGVFFNRESVRGFAEDIHSLVEAVEHIAAIGPVAGR